MLARYPSHKPFLIPSKILPDSWACRLFVITVLVETTIDLAIEGDLLVRLQDSGDDESALKMPVYLSVFALAQYAFCSPSVHVLTPSTVYFSSFLPWMQCTLGIPCNSFVLCQLV